MIIEITPRADRQIRAARRWWLQNRDKAPEAFDEEFARARNLMLNAPHAGQPVRTRHGNYIRRLTLQRVRYHLYYRIYPNLIKVMALWHTSRRPPRL